MFVAVGRFMLSVGLLKAGRREQALAEAIDAQTEAVGTTPGIIDIIAGFRANLEEALTSG
jgi:hypothetical protein